MRLILDGFEEVDSKRRLGKKNCSIFNLKTPLFFIFPICLISFVITPFFTLHSFSSYSSSPSLLLLHEDARCYPLLFSSFALQHHFSLDVQIPHISSCFKCIFYSCFIFYCFVLIFMVVLTTRTFMATFGTKLSSCSSLNPPTTSSNLNLRSFQVSRLLTECEQELGPIRKKNGPHVTIGQNMRLY